MKQSAADLPASVARSRLTSGEGGRERACGSNELERPLLGGNSPWGASLSQTPAGGSTPRGTGTPRRGPSFREPKRLGRDGAAAGD